MADEENLIISSQTKSRSFARYASHSHDELHDFRTWLKWLCVDQSNHWSACLSWFVFFALAIVVPAVSHFVLTCGADCDSFHSRPYDAVTQLSLSGIAALSFICLSTFVRKYGLRRFLFFDKLRDESETVRNGYTQQFNLSQEFTPSAAAADFPPENIIFCGKLIPYKQPHNNNNSNNQPMIQKANNNSNSPDLLIIESKQNRIEMWKISSTSNGARGTTLMQSPPPKKTYNTNKQLNLSLFTSSSSSGKTKWYFPFFGSPRFSTEVDLRDFKSRRRSLRRQFSSPPPPPPMFRFEDDEDDDDDGEGVD